MRMISIFGKGAINNGAEDEAPIQVYVSLI